MQQTCTRCGAVFSITADDEVFYKELRFPPPKDCPDCRSLKRCLHRNERSLYKRTCDLCSKDIVAMYHADAPFPVYCQACFFSDKWNPLEYGNAYDSSQSFFEQYGKLLEKVPHLSIINKQSQNSDYCNYAYGNKNCYLTSGSHYEEDCLYEAYSTKNKDSLDFLWMYGSELIYECMFSKNCYRCLYLSHCDSCSECLFSRDLKGCKNCLFCANLHQKQYYIANKPYTKEEYLKKLEELKLHTFTGWEKARNVAQQFLQGFPVKALYLIQCENCVGNMMSNCKNMRDCFFCSDSEDCIYGCQIDGTYSSMDLNYMGYDRSERCYQLIGCLGLFGCLSCNACWNGGGLCYCQFCFSCNDCFGCASLQQKTHCILNKEYSKEDYTKLIGKIIQNMQTAAEWGEFFPEHLISFAYNETMAMDWYPLSEREAHAQGYRWRIHEGIPDVKKIIPAERLPDSIDDIPDDVLNWAMICMATKRPFQITKRELAFYRNMRLPLPRIHPEERHKNRIERRFPRKLWKRKCAKCQREIMTGYAPERPEKVYCEECYLKEVY